MNTTNDLRHILNNGDSMKVKVKLLSRVRLFATPWTVSHQAPPSMEFSRQEYWSGLPFPSPGSFPTQGSNLGLPHCGQTLYPSEPPGNPGDSMYIYIFLILFYF